jgi:hypothetical protein
MRGKGVILLRPAELLKHALKALIIWKYARIRLRRGRGKNETIMGHIVLDNGCGYYKTLGSIDLLIKALSNRRLPVPRELEE